MKKHQEFRLEFWALAGLSAKLQHIASGAYSQLGCVAKAYSQPFQGPGVELLPVAAARSS